MKRLLALAVLLSGCAADPHAPRTISVGEAGGTVVLRHGERLRVVLPKIGAHAWERAEPRIPLLIAQGPPEGDEWMFTPVRSGRETLRFSMAQRTVAYQVIVP